VTSERRKRLTLVACVLGSAVTFLDGSIVNVALPALRDDLDAGLATQQWVVEAYLLTVGSLILVGGAYADVYGRRQAFELGLVAFGVTSVACAIAPSGEVLVAARALQGAAGALLVPASLAILTATFDAHERASAVGSWTAWTGIALVIGPLAGGAIIDTVGWRPVFAINVPIVLGTLWLSRHAIAESRDPGATRLDWHGALLSMLGLAAIVFALIRQPTHGWGDPAVGPLLAAGIALLAGFLVHERFAATPMLPLSFFRIRNFSAANAATFSIYGGLGAATFFVVIFLQQVSGYSAFEAGLALLPITILMFFLSSRFGALADRIGPRMPMTVGPLVAAAGFALLVRMDAEVGYARDVLPGVLLLGLGLAITVAPLTATALGAVAQDHAGIASGVNNAIARVASLVAIAVVGAVVASAFGASLDEAAGRIPEAAREDAKSRPLVVEAAPSQPGFRGAQVEASVDGFHAGMLVAAGLVAFGGVVSAVGIRNRARPAAPEPAAGTG